MNRIKTLIIAMLLSLILPLTFVSVTFGNTNLSTQIDSGVTSMVLYRNANLSLVEQEQRLSLHAGLNQLRFMWAGTSVDPTSLMLTPKEKGTSVIGLSFLPNSSGSAVWEIESKQSGESSFSLSYFSIGITTSTSYRLILNEKGDRAQLKGALLLQNRSREPFENIRLSLLVGSIQVLDDIGQLASRSAPYGRPTEQDQIAGYLPRSPKRESKMMVARAVMADSFAEEPMSLDQAEAISDYAFIPIPGSRTLKAGWSEASSLIDAGSVKVVNRFRYDEDRYGNQTIHLLDLVNNKERGLGIGPLPDGEYTVYQEDGDDGIFYQSKVSQGFIPVGGSMELNLGSVDQVQVVVKEIDLRTFDHQFDKRRSTGWREARQYRVFLVNDQSVTADIEIIRRMPGANWVIEHHGEYGTFKRIDQYRGAYRITLPPKSKSQFDYSVTSEVGSVWANQ